MKNKVKQANNEFKQAWLFITLLTEMTAPVLLVVWALDNTGSFQRVLFIVASILGANVLVKLYTLLRK